MTDEQREIRNLKKALKELSNAVLLHLRAMDAEMLKPESFERGKRIATICNHLNFQNDLVRYNALDVNFRTDKHQPLK